MDEIWKDIPNYEGFYQVSNLGRIKSLGNNRLKKEKIMKNRKSKVAGERIILWKDKTCKEFLVARLVAFTFLNEDINNHSLTVNHIDGNRMNNSIDNLELISLKENIQHGFRTGLYKNTQKKIKLTNKITGTIIYPSSLSEGSYLMGRNVGYISAQIIKNKFEDEMYRWELL